jgi:hypothetical protein
VVGLVLRVHEDLERGVAAARLQAGGDADAGELPAFRIWSLKTNNWGNVAAANALSSTV